MPLLTVITPTFNSERFITNCIENVIDQKCDDIEHVIVDGGSSDNTVKILEDYASRYPHIRYISEKDNGQTEAMNKGIRLAKSEVIGFLNVDDFYNEDTLPGIVKRFEKLPNPSFLVGICAIMDGDMNLQRFNNPYKSSIYHLLSNRYEFPQNPAAYFYHKQLHEEIGYYDEEEQWSMDLDWILRLASHIKFHHVEEVWGIFVIHEDCKTYIDTQRGTIEGRTEKVYKKYYNKLSVIGKMRVQFIKSYGFRLVATQYKIKRKLRERGNLLKTRFKLA